MSGGSAATYYTLDGGGQQTYTTPFSVAASSRKTITYWSVRAIGNIEGVHYGYVNIDRRRRRPPRRGCRPAAPLGWRNTSQTVTLTGSDNLSGVKTTYYTVDGVQHTYTTPFSVSRRLSHTITYWSVDAGGNIESFHTGYGTSIRRRRRSATTPTRRGTTPTSR